MATSLLESVIDAHGGMERWDSVERVVAHVRSGGLLPRTRMPGNRLRDYTVTVDARRPHAVLDPFPGEGQRAVFDGELVRIETGDGEVLNRSEPRKRFFGLRGLRRNLRWDALDTAYFAGYAMWNYMTTPWLLAREDVEVAESDESPAGRRGWRRLDVRFPEAIPTHSKHQSFFVDKKGLIRRHDYTAEVIGGWATAAHLCAKHLEVDGLVFPTKRRVRPQGPRGRALPLPILVSLDIDSIRLEQK